MKFDTVEKFLNYGIFTIPEYQRGYSWTKDQLQDFIEDLQDVEHIREHYAGTVTLIKSGQERIGITDLAKYDIVDGQQRLTTIHLLLVSIYHRMSEILPLQADSSILQYVTKNGKTLLRLNNNDNQEFYIEIINSFDITEIRKFTPKSKTEKNLLFTRIYFYNYLQKYTSLNTLIKIYNNLLSKFKVNVFELEEESEVGLIFETMNDRGLPLSDIDKVKNYLIYLSHRLNEKPLAKEINKKFGEIFTNLMSIENYSANVENQFLKHCYIVYQGDNKVLSDIPKKIKQEVIKHKGIFGNKNLFETDSLLREKKLLEIKDFNNFLHKAGNYYALVLNKTFDNKSVNNSFYRLENLTKSDAFFPLFISILNNKKYKIEYLVAVNEILEIFALRLLIFRNGKGNIGTTSLCELAFKIFKNEINITDLKKELRRIIDKNSSSVDIRKNIVNAVAYGNISNSALKLILVEYELNLRCQSKTVNYDTEFIEMMQNPQYSIEHIASQNKLPGSLQIENLNLIGNLVLTKNNSILSNKTFVSKKNNYEESNLFSERELTTYDDWNDKSIIDRGRKIQKFIFERWKI